MVQLKEVFVKCSPPSFRKIDNLWFLTPSVLCRLALNFLCWRNCCFQRLDICQSIIQTLICLCDVLLCLWAFLRRPHYRQVFPYLFASLAPSQQILWGHSAPLLHWVYSSGEGVRCRTFILHSKYYFERIKKAIKSDTCRGPSVSSSEVKFLLFYSYQSFGFLTYPILECKL